MAKCYYATLGVSTMATAEEVRSAYRRLVNRYACRRCAGKGSISGEMPVAIAYPPGIPDACEIVIPLDRYGMPRHRVSLLVRVVAA